MTREDIIQMAHKAGWNWPEVHTLSVEERLERFAKLVAEAEREACAKVCDEQQEMVGGEMCCVAMNCAEAIRARENT